MSDWRKRLNVATAAVATSRLAHERELNAGPDSRLNMRLVAESAAGVGFEPKRHL